MPTVSRFLTILALLAAAVYGAMYLLVAMVEPRRAEMSVRVPLDHLSPEPEQTGSTAPAREEEQTDPADDLPALAQPPAAP